MFRMKYDLPIPLKAPTTHICPACIRPVISSRPKKPKEPTGLSNNPQETLKKPSNVNVNVNDNVNVNVNGSNTPSSWKTRSSLIKNKEVVITTLQEKYTDKNANKVYAEFIDKTGYKDYGYKNYWLALCSWTREDKFNQYGKGKSVPDFDLL